MRIIPASTRIFERFDVVGLSGDAGGQSIGYRGIDTEAPVAEPWRREVFIKQFLDLIPGTEEANALPEHFASIKEKLAAHANYMIIPLDVGVVNGSMVAVYPWLRGLTLEEKLSALSWDERCRIAIALANTVRRLHKSDILHLDLKPANVVVKINKRSTLFISLIDLDSARIGGRGLRAQLRGTDGYMSPEHCQAKDIGSISDKADVFSLAVILAEMLFGLHPFPVGCDYRKMATDGAIAVGANECHRDVVRVIVEALLPQPALRPTAGQIHHVLHDHYGSQLKAGLEDHWLPATAEATQSRSFVQVCHTDGTVFRSYFDRTLLDRNELKGSKVGDVGHCPLALLPAAHGWWIRVTGDATVRVMDFEFRNGDSYKCAAEQELRIGAGRFVLRVVPME